MSSTDRPALSGLDLGPALGEGAGGVVFAAAEPELGRDVAVKVLSGARPLGVEQRFVAEARITARIDHPGVVPVHRLVRTAEGHPAYVMKRVVGVTLQKWLAARGEEVDSGARSDRADLPQRLEVFLKLADTVHFAHDRGVVHRDLKPDNVMIGRFGEVRVMDWGLAADVGGPTKPGAVEGTPGYLAPEQANGAPPTTAQDQYALGLLLQECVTLRHAVAGRTALERALANSMGQRVPAVARGGGVVPRELAAIVDKATALEPGGRYPDVRALAADVRRYLSGLSVTAAPDGPLQAIVRWVGRHREATLAGLVAAVALGAAAVAASEVRRARQQEEARREEAHTADRVAAVAGRAAHLDARLQRDQGLLSEIAAVTAERLEARTDGGAPWFADDPERAPEDLRRHAAWGQSVSLSTVVFVGPAGADRAAARALAGMGPTLRGVARRAVDKDDRSPRDEIAPIPWISVALTDGLSLSWPGHPEFTAGYDARQRPWYTVAIDADGPVWGTPYVDSSGLGLLLPCSTPVRDPDDGRVMGVASVKLSVDRLIGDLLAWDGATTWLLDGEGRVVASSEDRGRRALDEDRTTAAFDDDRVVDAVREGRPFASVDGGDAVVAHPLRTLGGAYVVRGPRGGW
jgi:hypothetical protein